MAIEVRSDPTFGLQTSQNTPQKATYSYATGFFTPVATPTDIVGINGSASKIIKIVRITLSSTQTTAGINNWFLLTRSTANTGSTPVAITPVVNDPNDPAATAVVVKYTATNPTTGSLVANVKAVSILTPAPATAINGDYVLLDDEMVGKPITLRGIAQGLFLNFNGAAVPAGLSLNLNIVVTEESAGNN